jgi:hypothetical protein
MVVTAPAPTGSWWRAARAALRLHPARPAWRSACWVVFVAACFAVTGAVFDVWSQIGLAYLAVACGALLTSAGSSRTRLVTAGTTTAAALIGLAAGTAAHSSPLLVVLTATLVGVIGGAIGQVGPALAGAAMTGVLGVAYGEFGGSHLPLPQLLGWYLLGGAALALPPLVGLLTTGRRQEAALIADLLTHTAALLDADPDQVPHRRADLVQASANARSTFVHHRLGEPGSWYAVAEAAALDAARSAAAGADPDHARAADLRIEVDRLQRDPRARPPAPPPRATIRPGQRLAHGLREICSPVGVQQGARQGLCLGIAAALTLALHGQAHSFWLPLTVAVVVRPEFGSVFQRTVNRVAGSLVGALVAGVVIMVAGSGIPVAAAAAVALGAGIALAPLSYGAGVIGVTGSALLSACIPEADPVLPALRLLDTLIGCAVALVVGYLLWPGERQGLDASRARTTALAAAEDFLDQVGRTGRAPAAIRDEAYRAAHAAVARTRAELDAPPPARRRAAEMLPAVQILDHLVDEIAAAEGTVDPDRVATLRRRLTRLQDPARH